VIRLLTPFETPHISLALLAPQLVVFGVAMLGILVEAFVPRRGRAAFQMVLAFGGLLAAFLLLVFVTDPERNQLAAKGSVAIDGPAVFLMGTVLVLSFVAFLLFAERHVDPNGDAFAPQGAAVPGSAEELEATSEGVRTSEIWPLAMFSVGGMLLFVSATDLLTMFVALEVLSLPLYLATGLARRRRLLSQEAALKYFLLGAYSSAFFLFGAAMLFGYAGGISFSDIATALGATAGLDPLLIIGAGLLAVGLFFKVGAVPFQAWTPDVYQGAPTPLTGFMAACVKVAAFGAMLRIFYVALGAYRWDWRPLFWGVAILTMLVGSIVAITQTDMKRMLAYSSIAQAGFILIGVLAANDQGLSSTMFYLVAYGFATIGAFAVVSLVRSSGGEATHLSSWAGLGKRAPWLAGTFTLFLLAFAGIPLTSGFTSKFAVFEAGIAGGAVPVVVVGVFASAIAAFFYVRVIVLMFFSEPAVDGPEVAVPSGFTTVALTLAVAATVLLGIVPGPVLDLANHMGPFIR
jgi:NADH-quinone oxidoreductase subunit N